MTRHTTGVAQAITRRSRSRLSGTTRPRPEPTLAERRRAADRALIAADDAILASAEELSALADPDLPTELRWTAEALAPFAAALAAAQHDVDSAFELRQEASSEPDPDTEAGLLELVESRSRAAGTALDAQTLRFDAGRNLERTVASVLPALNAKVLTLRERLTDLMRTTSDLAVRFMPVALAAARSDLDRTADRLDFAQGSLLIAGELLRSGDRRGAVARARAAEAAACQATQLLDEVAGTPDDLSRAVAGIDVLLRQTRVDLEQAHAAISLRSSTRAVRFTAATLEWASAAHASGRLDPVATRRALMESSSALSRVLGDTGGAAVVRHRAGVLDGCYTQAAAASVQNAATAIGTRRAVVGADARLRLALARRTFRAADQDEPVDRVAALQLVDRLADQALVLAQSDEARAHDRATAAGRADDDLAGAMLGGILVLHSSALTPRAACLETGSAAAPGGDSPRPGQVCAVSFGGVATRARRGGAGRF